MKLSNLKKNSAFYKKIWRLRGSSLYVYNQDNNSSNLGLNKNESSDFLNNNLKSNISKLESYDNIQPKESNNQDDDNEAEDNYAQNKSKFLFVYNSY